MASKHGKQTNRSWDYENGHVRHVQLPDEIEVPFLQAGLISTSLCVWLFQTAILLSTLWLIQSNVASIYWLVVSNMFFHHIGNVIIPTDELIFFRGVGQPPTRNWYSQLETSVASGIFQARPKGLFPESGWSGVQLWLHATPEGRGLESFHSKLPG